MAAVGTLTITEQAPQRGLLHPVTKLTLAWTSSAGGAVSGTLTGYFSGIIERIVFIPGSGGTQPSDLYDVTLLDESGVDVLAGQGANLSQSTTTHVKPGVSFKDGVTTSVAPIAVDDRLELRVANAGSAKTGTVVLYVLALSSR